MKLGKVALFGSLLLCLPLTAFAGPRPGQWQITTQRDMPGMSVPATTITHCVTPEEADHPEKTVPKGRDQSNCKVTDVKVDGNKMSWSLSCEGGRAGNVSGNGEITYAGDSYTGWMKMKVQDRDFTMKYTGKRIGDCDK